MIGKGKVYLKSGEVVSGYIYQENEYIKVRKENENQAKTIIPAYAIAKIELEEVGHQGAYYRKNN